MNFDLKGWVAIKIKPRQENRAKENLLKQGFNCYFPNLFSVKAGRQESVKQPMFPGYGFIRINENKSIFPINSTLGVVGIVHFGSHYPVVHPKILEGLKNLEKLSSVKPLMNIKAGDEVEILKGPLKGLKGIVSSIKKQRIEVLYTLLNQSHKTQLDSNLVNQL